MKLTTKQLKRIIKEELNKVMNESAWQDGWDAGKAGDDYDDSAYPDKKAKDNYEAGYYDGQRSEDPDLQGFVGSDSDDGDEATQPPITMQAVGPMTKDAVERMAKDAVVAYTKKHSNLAPFPPDLLEKVVKGALWYLTPEYIEDKIEDLIDTYARF